MPQFKNKVWDKVTALHHQIEEERGELGIQAGEIFKQRLQEKKKRQTEDESKCLEQLILQTSKTSAL